MDALKEQIKHEQELLRLLWVTALATMGGVLSLFLGEATPLRSGLAGLGLFAALILVTLILRQEREIRTLLQQMKEQKL